MARKPSRAAALTATVKAIRTRGWSALPLLAPGLVFANPMDGVVVGGAASISGNGNTLTIDQFTQNTAINWQSFSIGTGEYVIFNQPSSSSVALNRVLGGSPSEILGHLQANGQVFLINPSGVLFGQGSVVDVGGILASTLDISPNDFMAGRYSFAGQSAASILNAGNIRAADGGYVVFLGDNVANTGAITANFGTVLLASGSQATLDLQGDGLVNYALDAAAISDRAGVENLGSITADGGHVVLDADVLRDLKVAVINNAGLIQARKMTQASDGSILLVGKGGDIVNSGTLDASGAAPDVDGGRIYVTTDGDISMPGGSVLRADGGANAKGGEIRVIGKGTVNFDEGALISATGGVQGGFAELSGHEKLTIRGDVNLGNGGTLLIDPRDVTIAAGTGTNASGLDVTLYANFVQDQLQVGANVIIVADRSITIKALEANGDDGQIYGLNGSGTGGSLTLGIGTVNVSASPISGGNDAAYSYAGDPLAAFLRGDGYSGYGILFDDRTNAIRTYGGINIVSGDTYGYADVGKLETYGTGADIVVLAYGNVDVADADTNFAGGDITITSEYGNTVVDAVTTSALASLTGSSVDFTSVNAYSFAAHVTGDETGFTAEFSQATAGDITIQVDDGSINLLGGSDLQADELTLIAGGTGHDVVLTNTELTGRILTITAADSVSISNALGSQGLSFTDASTITAQSGDVSISTNAEVELGAANITAGGFVTISESQSYVVTLGDISAGRYVVADAGGGSLDLGYISASGYVSLDAGESGTDVVVDGITLAYTGVADNQYGVRIFATNNIDVGYITVGSSVTRYLSDGSYEAVSVVAQSGDITFGSGGIRVYDYNEAGHTQNLVRLAAFGDIKNTNNATAGAIEVSYGASYGNILLNSGQPSGGGSVYAGDITGELLTIVANSGDARFYGAGGGDINVNSLNFTNVANFDVDDLTIRSTSGITEDVTGSFVLTGNLSSGGNVMLDAGTIQIDGSVQGLTGAGSYVSGLVDLGTTGNYGDVNIGSIYATGMVTVLAYDGSITTTGRINTTGGFVGLQTIDNAGTSGNPVITIGGTGINSGGGAINLISTDGVVINASVNAVGGAITISADDDADGSGAIVHAVSTIAGGALNLNAAQGIDVNVGATTIGFSNTTSGAVAITEANGATVSGSDGSGGGIFITSATGDLTVGGNITTAGDVTLEAEAGDIVYGSGVVSGDLVTLIAGNATDGDVGTSTNRILTSANTVSFAATGVGNVYITESTGSYFYGSTGSGNIDVNVASGVLRIAGDISTSGNVTLSTTDGGMYRDAGTIYGNLVVLDANGTNVSIGANNATEVIQTSANAVSFEATGGGSVYITDTSLDGASFYGSTGNAAIHLTTLGGNLTVAGDIISLSNVVLNAAGGGVRHTGVGRVQGPGVQLLSASGGIGTSANRILTTATSISASSTSAGDIYISEADSTTFAGDTSTGNIDVLVAGTGNLTINGNISTTGDVTLTTTDGDIAYSAGVISGDLVTLTAGGTDGDVGASSGYIQTDATSVNFTGVGTGDAFIRESNGASFYGSTGSGTINLETTTGDLSVGGTIFTSGTAMLDAEGGDVLHYGGTGRVQANLLQIFARGADGDIGTSTNRILTSATTLHLDASNAGDIYVNEANAVTVSVAATTGAGIFDLNIAGAGDVLWGSGAFTLGGAFVTTADGSILRSGGGIFTANQLVLTANGTNRSIGTSGNAIETRAVTGSFQATGTGSVYITERADGGAATFYGSTGSGSIDLRTTSGNLTVGGDISTTGDVALTSSAGDLVYGSGTVSGNLVTLVAGSGDGDIGATGAAIRTDATIVSFTGAGTGEVAIADVSAVTFYGSTGSGAIDLSATNGSITVGGVISTTGAVTLTAGGTGSILDGNTGLDISSASVAFYAGGAIGSGDLNPLDLATNSLYASAGSGDIDLTNAPTAAVSLVGLSNSGSGAIRYSQGGQALNINGAITSGAGGVLIDPPTDVLINARINGGGGDVTIQATNNITFNNGGYIDNTFNVTLRADDDGVGGGAITDAQTAGNDITDITAMGLATLKAYGGIGTSSNKLELSSPQLNINETTTDNSAYGVYITAYGSGIELTGINNVSRLNLNSQGALSDAVGTTLNVLGIAQIAGTSITLGDIGSDITNFLLLEFNSAGAVSISEDSNTDIDFSNTAGTLSLTSSGSITDVTSTSLTVTGNSSFNATSITLGDSAGDITNFGSLSITSAGAVNITEDGNMSVLGFGSAVTNLSLTSQMGSISAGVGALSSSGALSLNAATTIAANNLTASINPGGTVSLNAGGNVSVGDITGNVLNVATTVDDFTASAITIESPALLNLDIEGNLSVLGAISTRGNISLVADGNVQFGQLFGDFPGSPVMGSVNLDSEMGYIQGVGVRATAPITASAYSGITLSGITESLSSTITLTNTNSGMIQFGSLTAVGSISVVNSASAGSILAMGPVTSNAGSATLTGASVVGNAPVIGATGVTITATNGVVDVGDLVSNSGTVMVSGYVVDVGAVNGDVVDISVLGLADNSLSLGTVTADVGSVTIDTVDGSIFATGAISGYGVTIFAGDNNAPYSGSALSLASVTSLGAGNDINLDADGGISVGALTSGRDLMLTGTGLSLTGAVGAAGNVLATSNTTGMNISGAITAGGYADITATGLFGIYIGADVYAGSGIDISSEAGVEVSGLRSTTGNIGVYGDSALILNGPVDAEAGAITLATANLGASFSVLGNLDAFTTITATAAQGAIGFGFGTTAAAGGAVTISSAGQTNVHNVTADSMDFHVTGDESAFVASSGLTATTGSVSIVTDDGSIFVNGVLSGNTGVSLNAGDMDAPGAFESEIFVDDVTSATGYANFTASGNIDVGNVDVADGAAGVVSFDTGYGVFTGQVDGYSLSLAPGVGSFEAYGLLMRSAADLVVNVTDYFSNDMFGAIQSNGGIDITAGGSITAYNLSDVGGGDVQGDVTLDGNLVTLNGNLGASSDISIFSATYFNVNSEITAGNYLVIETSDGAIDDLGLHTLSGGNGVFLTARTSALTPGADDGRIFVHDVVSSAGNMTLSADGKIVTQTLDAEDGIVLESNNGYDISVNNVFTSTLDLRNVNDFTANDVTLTSTGTFTESVANDFTINGSLTTGGGIALTAGRYLTLSTAQAPGANPVLGSVTLTGDRINLPVGLSAEGAIDISVLGAGDFFSVDGEIRSLATLRIDTADGAIFGGAGVFGENGVTLDANGTNGLIDLSVIETAPGGGGNVVISADSTIATGDITADAGIQITGGNSINTGNLVAPGSVDVVANGAVSAGNVSGDTSVLLDAQLGFLQAGNVASAGNVTLRAKDDVLLSGSAITFGGAALLESTSGNISFSNGSLSSASGTATLAAFDITLINTNIDVGTLNMDADNNIYLDPMTVHADGTIDLAAANDFTAIQVIFDAANIIISAGNVMAFESSALSASTINLTSPLITFLGTPTIGALTTNGTVQILDPVVQVPADAQSSVNNVTDTVNDGSSTSTQSQDETVAAEFEQAPEGTETSSEAVPEEEDSEETQDEETTEESTPEAPVEETFEGQTESQTNDTVAQECQA
ncbi:MAG: filamentous hemagglutinin N-terminal domain-containing protein [Pseudomonadota bacterium]